MAKKLLLDLDEIIRRSVAALHRSIEGRRLAMVNNNVEHLEIYKLLGFDEDEGRRIDLYQNIGRFVYKYAGALIEETTVAVLRSAKDGGSVSIPNSVSQSPKTFRIDFLVSSDKKGHEIKWRDATTDGDHIRKEHDKVLCISRAGFIPVKVMYYMPNREQAVRIQERIIAAYRKHGESHVGREAWDYIRDYTGFDLHAYLHKRIREIRPQQ